MNAWEEVDSDGNTVVCLVAVRYTKLWLEFGLGLGPGAMRDVDWCVCDCWSR